MRAYPISDYPARSTMGAALMHMVMNNLDPAVAQFPGELVTYGGNGSAFSNWAQYHETMRLLACSAGRMIHWLAFPLCRRPVPPKRDLRAPRSRCQCHVDRWIDGPDLQPGLH